MWYDSDSAVTVDCVLILITTQEEEHRTLTPSLPVQTKHWVTTLAWAVRVPRTGEPPGPRDHYQVLQLSPRGSGQGGLATTTHLLSPGEVPQAAQCCHAASPHWRNCPGGRSCTAGPGWWRWWTARRSWWPGGTRGRGTMTWSSSLAGPGRRWSGALSLEQSRLSGIVTNIWLSSITSLLGWEVQILNFRQWDHWWVRQWSNEATLMIVDKFHMKLAVLSKVFQALIKIILGKN